MKKITGHRHMCVNIRGMLKYFRRKSMAGLIVDKGRELSDEEARNYLYDHIEKGHKVLPMCDEDECPDFDYFGGGCPGHDVHYYDDEGNKADVCEAFVQAINNKISKVIKLKIPSYKL